GAAAEPRARRDTLAEIDGDDGVDSILRHEGPRGSDREILVIGTEPIGVAPQIDRRTAPFTERETDAIGEAYRQKDRIELVIAVGAPSGDAQKKIDFGRSRGAQQLDHQPSAAEPADRRARPWAARAASRRMRLRKPIQVRSRPPPTKASPVI